MGKTNTSKTKKKKKLIQLNANDIDNYDVEIDEEIRRKQDRRFIYLEEDTVDEVLNLIEDLESDVDMFMQDVVEYKRRIKDSVKALRAELKTGKITKAL